MADDGAFDDYPLPARAENKRKHEDSEEQDRKTGFSPSPGERVRKTGFSGPPVDQSHERKTGFSAPLSEQYDRKTGFSGPPPSEAYERKSGFSAPNEPLERKTGFSGPPGGEFERKTGFSGSLNGDKDRKIGFSGPPSNEFDRKSGFSSSPGSEYERKTGFSAPSAGGDIERKSGFSADQQERKTGFSGPPSAAFGSGPLSGLSPVEIAKQRAEQIAARLVAQDTKRPRVDDGADDLYSGKFDSGYPREDHGRGRMFQDHMESQHHIADQSGNLYNMQQGHFNSKRIDIPNGRVGVVIGKSGETIKGLQAKSGARIQITRDADHDPQTASRQVEIMGTPDQISQAEQLIKDVIAEAEAGGPGLFGGGGGGGYGGSGLYGEPIQIRVPTSKVGLIIGKGGETIKSMQSQSGARIQLVPVAMPDYSQERVITLVGTKQQTDMASDLIKEVIDENRLRGPPGGYNQQGFRPPGPPQWGQPRPPMQSQGYGFQQQQGSYSGQPQQYQSQPYGGYGQPPPSGNPQQLPQTQQGGYTQQSSMRPPQQGPGHPQSYGSPQDLSGHSHQYGGFGQRAPPGQQQHTPPQPRASPSDNNSGYNQSQPGYSQQSPYGQQGSAMQSPGQSAPASHPYGQAFSQQQPYGQPTSVQPGFGQQTVPPSGYSQQSYGSQGTSEQNPSTQPGYALPGSAQQAHVQQGLTHSTYGQQASNQPLGYGQQGPNLSQQEVQYGQGNAFQPTFSAQGASQQDASIQPTSYGQKEAPQGGYGAGGAPQPGYGGAPIDPGYGQAQPGYSAQGTPHTGYGQQGTLPGYGVQGPYGVQASSAPVYGSPQQANAPLVYGAQSAGGQPTYGSSIPATTLQPGYIQAGAAHRTYGQQGYSHGPGVQANPAYSEGQAQQGGPQQAYPQQVHDTSSNPSGNATGGAFDSSNASAGPGGGV